jgi:EAL domain-containing protein (putative c-di-GMP-specific phosphodiesterase class I)
MQTSVQSAVRGGPDGSVRPVLGDGEARTGAQFELPVRPDVPKPPRPGVATGEAANTVAALEARLDAYRAERTALAGALGAMHVGETPEATAAAIATALLGLHRFAGAGVFAFAASGDIVPLAVCDREGRPVALAGSLPAGRDAYLRDRASHGPWIEKWRPGLDHPHTAIGAGHRTRLLACAPIRTGESLVGLLVATALSVDELDVAERLPALVECATLAGALLGPQLRSRDAAVIDGARIRAIIAERAFLPVFQPIVELATGDVVGYEALTRFVDGSPPEQVFGEASRVGLTLELEAATLASSLEASATLPASVWLNFNASPEFVLAGESLASIMARRGRQLVLELTEHVAISDYAALRGALHRLGPSVRLAVDDAGAGFASLRHILELRPDYVKLDWSIVHGVHGDPARQALVAGMVHFAAKTGMTLVAEGVETAADARRLSQLGVPLAQGYRFGRPLLAGQIHPSMVTNETGGTSPTRSRLPNSRSKGPFDEIERAINIGPVLAAALRAAGVATLAGLQAIGAVGAWERLRVNTPRAATADTLLQLEGATRGVRVSQISTPERARLRLFARLGAESRVRNVPKGEAQARARLSPRPGPAAIIPQGGASPSGCRPWMASEGL